MKMMTFTRAMLYGCLLLSVTWGGSDALAWDSFRAGGKCLQTQSACFSTITNLGDTNQCCDASSAQFQTCAKNNVCRGGAHYRWPKLPVVWSLNMNGMAGKNGFIKLTAKDIEDTVKKAWDSWSNAACSSFAHSYAGQTTTGLDRQDQKNVVVIATPAIWSSLRLSSVVLGWTRVTADTGGKGIIEDADVVINHTPGQALWEIPPSVDKQNRDLLWVLTHELGHAVGFGHSQDMNDVMVTGVTSGLKYKGISKEDEQGLCTVYPASQCQASTTCARCHECNSGSCTPKAIPATATQCKGCNSDQDCGQGKCLALGGVFRCVQPCDTDGCCPSGHTCVEEGSAKVCKPDAGSCPSLSCKADGDCGKGEVCQQDTCQKAGCLSDSDCPSGEVCQAGQCTKVAPRALGEPCGGSIVCEGTLVCEQGTNGKVCTRSCAPNVKGFPAGVTGSPCVDRQCFDGSTCALQASGNTVCVALCEPNKGCSIGGTCTPFSSIHLCFCRQDSECKGGRYCNISPSSTTGRGLCAFKGDGQCPTDYTCQPNPDQKKLCLKGTSKCGDGTCDSSENCDSCAADCACQTGEVCRNNTCATPEPTTEPSPEPASETTPEPAQEPQGEPAKESAGEPTQETQPDAGNADTPTGEQRQACGSGNTCNTGLKCENNVCVKQAGCGCSGWQTNGMPGSLLLLLLCLGLLRRTYTTRPRKG